MKKIIYVLLITMLLMGALLMTACTPDNGEHVHTFTEEVVEPTCIDKGYTELTCSECGYVRRDSFTEPDPQKHIYEKVEEVASTCTAAGYLKEVCSVCGDEKVTDKAVAKHEMDAWYIAVESTCTTKGTERRNCKNCDHYETKELALAEHAYGEWEVSIVADCNGGEDKRICADCGHTDTRATAPVHKFSTEEHKPDCFNYGYTTYTCDLCGHTEDRDYVDPNGHDDEPIKVVETSCTEQGYTVYKCKVCGEEHTVMSELLPEGHAYDAVVTAPTCTEMGYTTYTCTVCEHSYVDGYTSPEHDLGEWVMVVEPHCPTLGVEKAKCVVCGHVSERFVDPKHEYVATVTEPTYCTEGYTTYTCACGDSYVSDYTRIFITEGLEYKLLLDNSGYVLFSIRGFEGDMLVIPESIEGIEGWGTLPVVEIRHNTFEGYTGIKTVVIPETVTLIGLSAFEGCEDLELIIYRGTMAQWEEVVKCNNWDLGTGEYTVRCTDGDIAK